MDARDALGRRGEDEAAKYLKSIGYRIVGRREKILGGDIDLVALDDRTVVFVEVRTRSNSRHGHPVETIDRKKQIRISDLANAFIQRHQLQDCSVRIDAVTVVFEDGMPAIEHYQNAFDSP